MLKVAFFVEKKAKMGYIQIGARDFSDVDISSTVLTVIDSVGLAQATTLNGYTSGEVTVNRVQDTYDNIKAIYNFICTFL